MAILGWPVVAIGLTLVEKRKQRTIDETSRFRTNSHVNPLGSRGVLKLCLFIVSR
jgi:hypothetical protein